jgi:hypothetical protein
MRIGIRPAAPGTLLPGSGQDLEARNGSGRPLGGDLGDSSAPRVMRGGEES